MSVVRGDLNLVYSCGLDQCAQLTPTPDLYHGGVAAQPPPAANPPTLHMKMLHFKGWWQRKRSA